ncbi:DUF4249 family protein [Kriegella sp. EG-1]|nr:DUF4249 family protein [Flavobacteriaceae bacterium EG-1]
MKSYIKLTVLFFAVAFVSCTDVIDVTVQSDETRLTVEASIDWEKGTAGNEQTIVLRTSTDFFDTATDTQVTGAIVKITNDANGTEFIFADQNNGSYTTTEFVPVMGQSYTLEITYNGTLYTAQETMTAVPEITDIFQDREDGFNDEELEAHIIFNDPIDEENFYLFKFQKQGNLLPDFEVGHDEFVNGNEIDWWYEIDEDDETDEIETLQPGDVLEIEMYGISNDYYNYMDILIEQIGGVGLFQATPVGVKGNVVNLANPEDYAHGYFRLVEVNKRSYTFE